jgi:hypothetical protein
MLPRWHKGERKIYLQRKGKRWESGTRWSTTSELNHCFLMYSYRNSTAMWPTVEKCCKSTEPHKRMEHNRGLYIHYSKCLVAHTCKYEAVCTRRNSLGVMVAHAARILSWSTAILRSGLSHTKDFGWPHRKISTGMRSGEWYRQQTQCRVLVGQVITWHLMLTTKPTAQSKCGVASTAMLPWACLSG